MWNSPQVALLIPQVLTQMYTNMADIFSATNERRNSVPTTTFDWSHAVHTTTDLGRITPVFCELVPAKTSARINAKLGFQFMPMVFPLQSRIRYRLAFFKYPLRALWTDYRDFIGNFRQDLEEPYIDFAGHLPATGFRYHLRHAFHYKS